jgi:hypothetical protein
VVDEPLVVSAGDAPAVGKTIVVALYDAGSGHIVHLHTVHLHADATEADDDIVVTEARGYAAMLGHDVDNTRAAISTDPRHGSVPHRIDPETGRFVPLT